MLEVLATGLRFPEGPVSLADGSVLVVEVERGTLTCVSTAGSCEVVAELGGGPNGMAIGPGGQPFICNNGGNQWIEIHGMKMPHGPADGYRCGSIQRVDLATGSVVTLYEECNGELLRGPNDIVFDRHGGFWFTDFGKDVPGMRHMGGLFYALSDGSKITRVAQGLLSPNGVGLSADETQLYVSDTFSGRLFAFDVIAPGNVNLHPHPMFPGRLTHTPPGLQMLDSLAVENGGNIVVATIGANGMTICWPDGHMEFIDVPDPFPTNICFGGEDMATAWITGSGTGSLFKTEWPRPGLRLFHQR